MGMSVRCGFLVAVYICIQISVTAGLKCYACLDVDSAFATALNAPTLVNPRCRGDVDEDTPGVSREICPDPPHLHIVKCGTMDGRAVMLVGNSTVRHTVTMFGRGCYPQPINTVDECRSPTAQDRVQISKFFGDHVTMINGTGQGCTCSDYLCNSQVTLHPTTISLLIGLFMSLCRIYIW